MSPQSKEVKEKKEYTSEKVENKLFEEREKTPQVESPKEEIDSIEEVSEKEGVEEYFGILRGQLGFKKKLNLVLKHALLKLENETSKFTGYKIEKLRKDFLSCQKLKLPSKLEGVFPIRIVIYDYRSFLINIIFLSKKKKDYSNYLKEGMGSIL